MRKKLLILALLLTAATHGAWAQTVIDGEFTINNSGDKVKFSKGNLQATWDGSAWSWGFAANQWDCGTDGNTKINGNGTLSGAGTVDLFGWSTEATYFGIYNSTSNNDYSGDFKDYAENVGTGWRTLSLAEWLFLFNNRTTTSGVRYAKAVVNGVNGVILLPDNWDTNYHSLNSPNTGNAAFTSNSISSSVWASGFESHGAVFLPLAGHRGGVTVSNVNVHACYWSSTSVDGKLADKLYIDKDYVAPSSLSSYGRATGASVRLVIPPLVTLTDGQPITALTTFAGQKCTVTYKRSFTSGKASTVCLPFAYTKKAGDGSFYAFTNIEKQGNEYVATMTEPGVSTLAANTPYLYMPNATGEVDFSGTYTISDLTAGSYTSNGWTFKGTYETINWTTAPTGIYGFSAGDANDGITQGQFVKAGENVSIQPMRCYLENESFTGARGMKRAEQLPETIKVRLVNASGGVTAIGSLQTKTGEVTLDGDTWHSLDGRRMEGKPATKGIYINNNKKVIIK